MNKLAAFFNGISLVNVAVMAAQVAGAFPSNKYAMMVQMILQTILPSLGGVGHKVAYGKKPGA